MTVRILRGDCREVLRTLADESVHCVVTSPPYWGLRDYGTAKWEGGDPGCDHQGPQWRTASKINQNCGTGNDVKNAERREPYKQKCGKCGARRIDSQIGLEQTFQEYVDALVKVFREVKRVLRRDGTLWLNMGDSYAGGGHGRGESYDAERNWRKGNLGGQSNRDDLGRVSGLKPKDLCGIPWRLAFALQADGWYLRSDIIWAKPNPMPESATDRPTKSHEYLFLLSRSERYYYDGEAVKEPGEMKPQNRFTDGRGPKSEGYAAHRQPAGMTECNGRNARTVWTIATAPFPGAHFATFPPALVEPCIKAGTSEKGCCAKCGKPWRRETEKEFVQSGPNRKNITGQDFMQGWESVPRGTTNVETLGWFPSCSCDAAVVPATCLDPFGGAGTTGLVADRLGRNAILIELSPQYAEMAERRLQDDAGIFAMVVAE